MKDAPTRSYPPLWLSVVFAFIVGFLLADAWIAVYLLLVMAYLVFIVLYWQKYDDKLTLCLPLGMFLLGGVGEEVLARAIRWHLLR